MTVAVVGWFTTNVALVDEPTILLGVLDVQAYVFAPSLVVVDASNVTVVLHPTCALLGVGTIFMLIFSIPELPVIVIVSLTT